MANDCKTAKHSSALEDEQMTSPSTPDSCLIDIVAPIANEEKSHLPPDTQDKKQTTCYQIVLVHVIFIVSIVSKIHNFVISTTNIGYGHRRYDFNICLFYLDELLFPVSFIILAWFYKLLSPADVFKKLEVTTGLEKEIWTTDSSRTNKFIIFAKNDLIVFIKYFILLLWYLLIWYIMLRFAYVVMELLFVVVLLLNLLIYKTL